jgi:hypothetical protein
MFCNDACFDKFFPLSGKSKGGGSKKKRGGSKKKRGGSKKKGGSSKKKVTSKKKPKTTTDTKKVKGEGKKKKEKTGKGKEKVGKSSKSSDGTTKSNTTKVQKDKSKKSPDEKKKKEKKKTPRKDRTSTSSTSGSSTDRGRSSSTGESGSTTSRTSSSGRGSSSSRGRGRRSSSSSSSEQGRSSSSGSRGGGGGGGGRSRSSSARDLLKKGSRSVSRARRRTSGYGRTLSKANKLRRRTGAYITGHGPSGRPYTRLYNPPNYIYSSGGWNTRRFGYGYGSWWAWRYPSFSRLALPYYSLWFPYRRWRPYYYVTDQAAVEDYDRGAGFVDPGVVIRNDAFTTELPDLPTFVDIGVNIDLLKSINPDNPSQVAIFENEIKKIQSALARLKVTYANEIVRGYFPSPDFDEERFSWIQDADMGRSD